MEKDNYFFKLLFILFILGIFAYMGINDRSHKGKTFWYKVIDKRESVGSHFSIINKGVRTDYNIIFKRIDNGKLFPCKDVEYGDYIQYQLNYKYSITEEDMQRLSGIYNRDFYKSSNPQPIGFSGILLAKRQNSFYCTYFLHNRNVADTKSPYPIKRLEVIRWFNQKSMVFNQSLS